MYVAVSLAYYQGLYSESPRQSTSREVTIPGHATFSQQSPLDCSLHWRSRLRLIDQLVFYIIFTVGMEQCHPCFDKVYKALALMTHFHPVTGCELASFSCSQHVYCRQREQLNVPK